MDHALQSLYAHARRILDAGLDAAEPGAAVRRTLRRDRDRLVLACGTVEDRFSPESERIFDLNCFRRVVVVGAGKASAAMGAALEGILGDRLDRGLLVTKDGHRGDLRRLEQAEAAHPVPDARGTHAAGVMGRFMAGCRADCLVLAAISGGASALLSLPADGLTLVDKAAVTDALLRSGADINALNAVRKHLSAIKGGRAAALAAPATVVALLLSDVIGDPPDVIGSGPFSPDPSTYEGALRILVEQLQPEQIPKAIRGHLEAGVRGELNETPKPEDPLFDRVHTRIVASNRESLAACRAEAEALGYAVHDLGGALDGPAEDVARLHADLVARIRAGDGPVPAPACVLSGGEPTVTVRGPGRGGRNQHLALAAVPLLADLDGVVLLAAGTDGTDGPTDAAGAFADSSTAARASAADLDPAAALCACDSYPFFKAIGDLLITGPTGTNVMDLHISLVDA